MKGEDGRMKSREDDVKKLITEHQRRLHILKVQKARMGISTPPEVQIDIENIEAEVKDLEAELSQIQSPNSTSGKFSGVSESSGQVSIPGKKTATSRPPKSEAKPSFLDQLDSVAVLLVILLVITALFLFVGRTIVENNNPWSLTGLFAVYLLTILVVSLIVRIFQGLGNRWISLIVDWLDDLISERFSKQLKNYLQYLSKEYQFYDMKGLNTQNEFGLELEDLFIELRILPQTLEAISTNPLQHETDSNLQSNHIIWDFLKSKQLSSQNFVIIGPPGSGKTTLLKHITLTLAAKRSLRRKFGVPKKLPVLLYLRDHASSIKADPNLSLIHVIENGLSKQGFITEQGWFEKHLKGNDNWLIMLDGLDEVADENTRKQVVDWVEQQIRIYNNNRFIITSRPFGYQNNPLSRVTTLEVRPFTIAQAHKFIQKWYLTNEIMSAQKDDPGVRKGAQKKAIDLIDRLNKTPALLDMTGNPLSLTMIATVHRNQGSLPERRVALYAEICEVFLGKHQQARGLALDLTPGQKQHVLQPLAYHLMCTQSQEFSLEEASEIIFEPLSQISPNISGREFLKMIENQSGLLIESKIEVYSFAHLTFQEYLAAVYMRVNNLESELVNHIEDSWWIETIRLYTAQSNTIRIIDACLADDKLSLETLNLAIQCLEESPELEPDARVRLKAILDEKIDGSDPEWQKVVAKALLTHRLQNKMIPVKKSRNEGEYIDTSPISYAEFQLFVDEQQANGKYHPYYWQNLYYRDKAKEPVVGIQPSDAIAFCNWLTVSDEKWRYRLPKAKELDFNLIGDDQQSWIQLGIGFWIDLGKETIGYRRSRASRLPIGYTFIKQRICFDFKHATNCSDSQMNLEPIRALGLERSFCRVLNNALYLHKRADNIIENVEQTKRYINSQVSYIADQQRMLENQSAALKQQKLKLEQQLSSISATTKDLGSKLQVARSKEESLESELSVTRSRKRDLEYKLSSLPSEFSLKKQISDVAAEISQLESQLHQANLPQTGTDSITTTISTDYYTRSKLEDARSRHYRLESQLEALIRESYVEEYNIKDQLASISQKINDLENDLAVAKKQRVNLGNKYVKARNKKLGLENDLAPLLAVDNSDTLFRELIRAFHDIQSTLNGDFSSPLNHILKLETDQIEQIQTILKKLRNTQKYLKEVCRDLRSKLSSEKTFSQASTIENLVSKLESLSNDDIEKIINGLNFVITQVDSFEPMFRKKLQDYSTFNIENNINTCLKFYYDTYLFTSLTRALKRFRELARIPVSEYSDTEQFLRSYIRLCVLAVIIELLSKSSESLSLIQQIRKLVQIGQDPGKDSDLLDICLNLYIDFSVLEARVSGEIPALEGMWIAKERVRN